MVNLCHLFFVLGEVEILGEGKSIALTHGELLVIAGCRLRHVGAKLIHRRFLLGSDTAKGNLLHEAHFICGGRLLLGLPKLLGEALELPLRLVEQEANFVLLGLELPDVRFLRLDLVLKPS